MKRKEPIHNHTAKVQVAFTATITEAVDAGFDENILTSELFCNVEDFNTLDPIPCTTEVERHNSSESIMIPRKYLSLVE